MNLRFVWHILRKDTRRLWWMIALTLALLWRLVHFDSWRAYAMPGTEEGWLNFLLPLAWALLIALVLFEDPVLGEGPFWKTVPCGWQSLVAAKAGFVAVFIHVPYFVGCIAILQARGFAPADNLPALLGKQLALLAITLPAFALATIVSNVTQFMMIAIIFATAVAIPSFGPEPAGVRHLREVVMYSTTGLAAVWIAISQYGWRRTSSARVVGAAAILIAAVFWWLPREAFYGLQAALSPAPESAPELSVHRSDTSGEPGNLPFRPEAVSIGIPIRIDGLTNGKHATLEQAALTVEDARGYSYRAEAHTHPLESRPLVAWVCCGSELPDLQMLWVDKDLLGRIGNSPVTLKGRILAEYYRLPDPVRTSVGANVPVANVGRCSSNIQTGGGNPNDERLHVGCESPRDLPMAGIGLTDPGTGREWNENLGASYTFESYLRSTWLSPVYRQDAYFSSTDEEHYNVHGGQWLVPREVIESVRIAITPEAPEGYRLFDYELPDIRLNQFEVKK